MTEQAKHQALLVDRLRRMVVHARRRRLRGRPARRWRSWPGSAARRSARRRGFSGSPRDHRYPASACPSAPRRTARSPPAPAERPPARRRRGPQAPSLLNSSAATWRFSALSSTTSRRTPATAGCAPPARRRVGRGALFAVQRMQHRVGQLLGRDRLGENRREGRRAVVARIGQHLAAIGGDHDHHGRRQVALQLADQLRRAESRRDRGMRQSISTTS